MEPGNEGAAGTNVRQSPSAPGDLQHSIRDSSPENQSLLSDVRQPQSDVTLVSDRTSQEGNTEEGEGRGRIIFY